MQIFYNRRKYRNRRKTIIRIFTGDVDGHLQSKMTRGTLTKLETQVQGGTALKQLPGNGRQSRRDGNTGRAYDMGDCAEGVRRAHATVVSERLWRELNTALKNAFWLWLSIGILESVLLCCTLGSKAEISLASKVSASGSGWLQTGL